MLKHVPYFWQTQQWQYLAKRRQGNHLPHAILLTGIAGLGKNDFARAFAHSLFCEQPDALNNACNACRSCHLFNKAAHPDSYSLHPEEPNKAIRVDQVRELITHASQTTHQGSYKTIIISPAEMLNTAAANALLKTLEEPVAHTCILLVTDQLGLLPATIRSRCQILQFATPPMAEAKQWLIAQDVKHDVELFLALAEGAPLAALHLAEQKDTQHRQKLLTHLQALAKGDMEPISVAALWLKINLQQIITWLTTITMDVLRLQMQVAAHHMVNQDYLEFLNRLAVKSNSLKLFAYLDELYEYRRQLNISNSLNQQLLLENLFCKWQQDVVK